MSFLCFCVLMVFYDLSLMDSVSFGPSDLKFKPSGDMSL